MWVKTVCSTLWNTRDLFVVCSLILGRGQRTVEQRNSTRVFLKKFKIKKSFLKKEVWQCSILLELLKNIAKPVHSSIFGSVDSVPSSLGH